ncbi:probable Zn-dependent hydrolases, including glyoxylases [Phialocephala subalpina]|uniref:Probable Zn-dependent hydrolases, including glyoxylases n=1 Tax=Phialocephala subalpina TaxID=576137 RepID=A0A1L7XAU4_9HELO|nr:probable Zn-dependent hydrolases, including glyoxylases [Phialocephala subalpina]
MSSLKVDVYIAPPIPWKKPNGTTGGLWSPISSTLIHSSSSAILVDTPITTSQTTALISWIKATIPNKKLTKIYITHGHGDHFFGIPLLLKEFPEAEAIATKGTVEHIKQQVSPSFYPQGWESRFPGEIPQPFVLAKPLPSNGLINLDNYTLHVIEVGQADTHSSTVLWVPTLKLAVCGDVVYGSCHQMLGECDTRAKREAWIESIRKVGALGPELVVPGHMVEGEGIGSGHIAETRIYIERFEEELGKAGNARELAGKMIEAYPERFNEGALIVGCVNAFKTLKKDKAGSRL